MTTVLSPIAPAFAAHRHVARSSRPAVHAGMHHAQSAHGNGHRHGSRTASRSRYRVPFVHSGVAPLANAVWDNPQMPPAVANAIRSAASATGVDPHLLAAIAWRESRFDAKARNHWSSATGLLQFTNSTWLRVVHTYGAQHEAGAYSEQITRDAAGGLVVADTRARATIMQLRSDPVFAAALAADVLAGQRSAMAARLGRDVAMTDLYLLHVLGATGSARFLEAVAARPGVSAQSVASRRILRQAGLLARDGYPMTVGNTYKAVELMLADQRRHSELLLAAQSPAVPLEVGQAP